MGLSNNDLCFHNYFKCVSVNVKEEKKKKGCVYFLMETFHQLDIVKEIHCKSIIETILFVEELELVIAKCVYSDGKVIDDTKFLVKFWWLCWERPVFTAIKIALQFIFLKALSVELNCSLAVFPVLPEDFTYIWAYTRLLDDRKHWLS